MSDRVHSIDLKLTKTPKLFKLGIFKEKNTWFNPKIEQNLKIHFFNPVGSAQICSLPR